MEKIEMLEKDIKELKNSDEKRDTRIYWIFSIMGLMNIIVFLIIAYDYKYSQIKLDFDLKSQIKDTKILNKDFNERITNNKKEIDGLDLKMQLENSPEISDWKE